MVPESARCDCIPFDLRKAKKYDVDDRSEIAPLHSKFSPTPRSGRSEAHDSSEGSGFLNKIYSSAPKIKETVKGAPNVERRSIDTYEPRIGRSEAHDNSEGSGFLRKIYSSVPKIRGLETSKSAPNVEMRGMETYETRDISAAPRLDGGYTEEEFRRLQPYEGT